MSPKEASRLRATEKQPAVPREEGSAARPLVRDLAEKAPGAAAAQTPGAGPDSEAAPQSVEAHGQSPDELERAAENIRPSWHGAEVEAAAAPAAPTGLPPLGSVPAALPPPPALPSFSSFPIEQRAPFYSADSTVRTAAVLPERLAQLLNQPQIAHASHWLSARPWAIAGVTIAAVILLALLIWPSAPEPSPRVAKEAATSTVHRAPPPPASAPSTQATPPAAAERAATSAGSSGEPAPPASSAKKKRAGRVASKPSAPKARKPTKPVAAPVR